MTAKLSINACEAGIVLKHVERFESEVDDTVPRACPTIAKLQHTWIVPS